MNIESYREEVRSFVKRGNFHAALNVAVSGLNECRRNNDQVLVDQCIGVIREVVEALAQAYGSRENLERP